MHSRGGVKQGGPLAMVAYIIGILLLIKNLKAEFPDATHPYYDDYSGAQRTFARVKPYFNLLKRIGPGQGYYPKPSKRFWLCICTISKLEKCLAYVIGLRWARACVILAVLLGMTIPNLIA